MSGLIPQKSVPENWLFTTFSSTAVGSYDVVSAVAGKQILIHRMYGDIDFNSGTTTITLSGVMKAYSSTTDHTESLPTFDLDVLIPANTAFVIEIGTTALQTNAGWGIYYQYVDA